MKKSMSYILFGILVSTSAIAYEVKTEYITEEVCPAIAGCWMNPKTGECPDCITITRKVVVENYNTTMTKPKTAVHHEKNPEKKKSYSVVGTLWECLSACQNGYMSFYDDAGNWYDKNMNRTGSAGTGIDCIATGLEEWPVGDHSCDPFKLVRRVKKS